jgi:hypothetical protein
MNKLFKKGKKNDSINWSFVNSFVWWSE